MKEYYDRRAPEYDDAYFGRGVWDDDEAAGVAKEVPALEKFVASLAPARTLDVGCGTGFLTRLLRGFVIGVDQSARMLAEARERDAAAAYMQGDATALPARDESFERVFSSHMYGRLELRERLRFLDESRRVAPELIVLDTPFAPGQPEERLEERPLLDGTTYRIYKRYFRPEALVDEIGGGEIVLSLKWFVAVRHRW